MSAPLPNAPSAERNKGPILEHLRELLPADAAVLEIASGTGQHVAYFAAQLPQTRWQPTDADAQNLLAIAGYCDQAHLRNVHAPQLLDVHERLWRVSDDYDAVLAINLIHIAPWSATPALFEGARRVLRPGGAGLVVLYGAYLEDGRHTSASNQDFDASLRARNPGWGVRDLQAVTDEALRHGFTRRAVHRMPANNLLVVFGR